MSTSSTLNPSFPRHFTEERAENRRGSVSCPAPHSQSVASWIMTCLVFSIPKPVIFLGPQLPTVLSCGSLWGRGYRTEQLWLCNPSPSLAEAGPLPLDVLPTNNFAGGWGSKTEFSQFLGDLRFLCRWTSVGGLCQQSYVVKAMVFPVVMYGCESWAIKKAEC